MFKENKEPMPNESENDPNAAAEEAEYEEELKKTAKTLGIDTDNPNWRERITNILKEAGKREKE